MGHLVDMQVFGKDSFLTLGCETDASRQQWGDDVDEPVIFSHTSPVSSSCAQRQYCFKPECFRLLGHGCALQKLQRSRQGDTRGRVEERRC